MFSEYLAFVSDNLEASSYALAFVSDALALVSDNLEASSDALAFVSDCLALVAEVLATSAAFVIIGSFLETMLPILVTFSSTPRIDSADSDALLDALTAVSLASTASFVLSTTVCTESLAILAASFASLPALTASSL